LPLVFSHTVSCQHELFWVYVGDRVRKLINITIIIPEDLFDPTLVMAMDEATCWLLVFLWFSAHEREATQLV